MTQQEYNEYVKKITPTNSVVKDMAKAFVSGGGICVLGEFIKQWFINSMGMEKEAAGTWESIVLVGIAILLTGLNIFPYFVKFAGAGALVPITGFANSVSAAAIEYKKEGQVFGIGCKIFTIAGPVILFGVFTSWVLGVLYWLMQILGW